MMCTHAYCGGSWCAWYEPSPCSCIVAGQSACRQLLLLLLKGPTVAICCMRKLPMSSASRLCLMPAVPLLGFVAKCIRWGSCTVLAGRQRLPACYDCSGGVSVSVANLSSRVLRMNGACSR